PETCSSTQTEVLIEASPHRGLWSALSSRERAGRVRWCDASSDWEQEGDPVFVEDMTISAERDGRPASVSSVPSAHVNRLGNRLRYVAAPGPGDPGTKGYVPQQAPPPLTRSDNQGGINV